MADFYHRYPQNVPGKFYTDALCLDCTVCREIAPDIFVYDPGRNISYVARQPVTKEEVEACELLAARCPCDAIGKDGDQHQWDTEPPKWRFY
jgi:ferredoxin